MNKQTNKNKKERWCTSISPCKINKNSMILSRKIKDTNYQNFFLFLHFLFFFPSSYFASWIFVIIVTALGRFSKVAGNLPQPSPSDSIKTRSSAFCGLAWTIYPSNPLILSFKAICVPSRIWLLSLRTALIVEK